MVIKINSLVKVRGQAVEIGKQAAEIVGGFFRIFFDTAAETKDYGNAMERLRI